MKKASQEKPRVRKDSRHIRWSWEKSDSPEIDGVGQVRYHFIIVDDKRREARLNQLLQQLQEYGNAEEIRRTEGRVRNSDLRYLFASYDSTTAPRMIKWSKIERPVVRDRDLSERQKGSVEDYVASVYS